MIRLKYAVCVFLLCGSFAFAQIRDYVCIVRPVYSGETQNFFLSTAKRASMLGYRDLARAMKSKNESGFGSGFFVSDPDGTMYVITNRHVIADADKVTIKLERSDGTMQILENCIIEMVSYDLDLALISIKSVPRLQKGLSFTSRKIRDGEEIWSAGYPGLGEKPSWQLGKGTVTNQAARVPDLVDPAVSTLIQHSAPVDPGNSGGPLLVLNTSRPAGYDVVGVNTWKAFMRQATNFAVPSAAISGFISNVDDKYSVSSAALEERADILVSIISSQSDNDEEMLARIRKISYLISPKMLICNGQNDLFTALASAPTAVRDVIIQNIMNSLVFDAMRIASAWRLEDRLSSPVFLSRYPVFPVACLKQNYKRI